MLLPAHVGQNVNTMARRGEPSTIALSLRCLASHILHLSGTNWNSNFITLNYGFIDSRRRSPQLQWTRPNASNTQLSSKKVIQSFVCAAFCITWDHYFYLLLLCLQSVQKSKDIYIYIGIYILFIYSTCTRIYFCIHRYSMLITCPLISRAVTSIEAFDCNRRHVHYWIWVTNKPPSLCAELYNNICSDELQTWPLSGLTNN